MEPEYKATFLLTRKNFYLLFLLSFLIPHFVVVGVAMKCVAVSLGKTIFLTALFVVGVFLSVAFMLLQRFEKRMQEKVAHLVRVKSENSGGKQTKEREEFESRIEHLENEIEQQQKNNALIELERNERNEKIRALEFELQEQRRSSEKLQDDLTRAVSENEEQFKSREGALRDYHQTIQEQRSIIEKKQRHIHQLESKVRDQMYEIRSLLQLEETQGLATPPPLLEIPEKKEDLAEYYLPSMPKMEVATSYDISLLLQKYIGMAEKFTPMGFKEENANLTIDLRYLFDALRDETTGIVFVYSKKEGKFLFVNQQVKKVLGWSPEKLRQDFSELIVSGGNEFHQQIQVLSSQKEGIAEIVIKDKSGAPVPFQCHLSQIQSGPFSNQIIGVLQTGSLSGSLFQ